MGWCRLREESDLLAASLSWGIWEGRSPSERAPLVRRANGWLCIMDRAGQPRADTAALLGFNRPETLGHHHPPDRVGHIHGESICAVSTLDQRWLNGRTGGPPSRETCPGQSLCWGSNHRWVVGTCGGQRGKSPGTAARGAPAPAHLLSPRESVVEAGHVSHDGFLIWPQSAYNICAEGERKREREAGEGERCGEGGRGRTLGSCGRNSACSGLEAKPWLRLCGHVSLRFRRGKQTRLDRWGPFLTDLGL